MRTTYLAVFGSILSLAACAAPAGGEAIDGSAAEQASSTVGVELRGTGQDAALTISLAMPKRDNDIWDTYLTRARVSRGNVGAFDSYCGVDAKLGSDSEEISVSCTKYTASVDPRQSLKFQVVLRTGNYSLRNVELHGTELASERDLLTGGRGDAVLTATRTSTEPTQNPFAGPQRINAALRPLFGTNAYARATGKDEPITGFEYSFDQLFGVAGTVLLDHDHRGSFLLTLARTQYHAAQGLLTDAELAERVRNAMPKAPQCNDGPTPGGVTKPVTSIENAITPLGGPSFGLADEVKLSDVPAALAAKLKKAGEEIASRSFSGTDYAASVFGYYAIHASCADKTIVAYVVWGGGSGEPDYHDGVVIGFDLNGQQIHDAKEDG